MKWLHRYAVLVACATVLLIAAGGMVTSTGSGLAVPDWPNTYGWFMFNFPLEKMVGGILYEHGHRLIASIVGFLTIVLAVWIWRVDERPWMRKLGFAALAAVIVQGLLGGITVLLLLPAPVSIGHAGLAQLFFCSTVAIALFTSAGWRSSAPSADDPRLRSLALMTTVLIYVQILIGATMRHTGAGLAIPDFPLIFGGILPPEWNIAVAVHFTHRLGAVVVLFAILTTALHVRRAHLNEPRLSRPASLLVFLVLVQGTLGAFVIWSGLQPVINTAHVANGAILLGTSLVLTLRSYRKVFDSSVVRAGLRANSADRFDAAATGVRP